MFGKIKQTIGSKRDQVVGEYETRLREKAIEKAKVRIVLHGRSVEDYSPDDLEIIVKEEEDKLREGLKNKGLYAVMAFLGFNAL